MENKLFRNSVSVLMIAVMVMSVFAIPIMLDTNNAYAESTTSDTKSALGKANDNESRSVSSVDGMIEAKADSLLANCGTTLPASLTYNKTHYFQVVSDGWDKIATSYVPAYGEIAYVPAKMTFYDPNKLNRGSENLYNISPSENYYVLPDKLGTWTMEMTFWKYKYNNAGITSNTTSDWVFVAEETKVISYKSTGPQKKYKLKLNANKGKISGKKTKTKKVTSYNKYGKLATPKRSGYNFAGWYTKKKGGSFVNKNTVNTKTKKHTIYAHWVKKSKYATNSQYKAVKVGMTYSEVKRIFGKKGKYLGLTSGAKVYGWYMNKSKTKACGVAILNGVVVQKIKV